MKQRAPSASRRACGGLFIAFLTLIGGYAAWATQPSSQASTVMDPDWSSRPDGADLARLYPAKAQAERLEGMAVIECYVERSGALSGCTILRETPEAAGFGDATLQMAPLFQMKPKSKSGKPVAGGVVRIPVKFMVPATGGQS